MNIPPQRFYTMGMTSDLIPESADTTGGRIRMQSYSVEKQWCDGRHTTGQLRHQVHLQQDTGTQLVLRLVLLALYRFLYCGCSIMGPMPQPDQYGQAAVKFESHLLPEREPYFPIRPTEIHLRGLEWYSRMHNDRASMDLPLCA